MRRLSSPDLSSRTFSPPTSGRLMVKALPDCLAPSTFLPLRLTSRLPAEPVPIRVTGVAATTAPLGGASTRSSARAAGGAARAPARQAAALATARRVRLRIVVGPLLVLLVAEEALERQFVV